MEKLRAGARQLGLDLSAEQIDQFGTYSRELLDWNTRINLTAITDPEEIESRHFLDSLSCLTAMVQRRGDGKLDPADVRGHAIDVGAGAGFPGLALRLVCPHLHLTLVDSVGKKTRFLQHVVQALGMEKVSVVNGRAEDLARQPAHRDRYDWCLARALAPLPVLLEYCLPFLRSGGRLVAPKKGDIDAERDAARPALKALRGRLVGVTQVVLDQLPDERVLLVIEKTGPTPELYPRRAGIPARQPIGKQLGPTA
ncbi:MAG: 16S rRNA (guanine(527)-N(7))-methyltransferase RsmG [Chloroflexota bacterium]